MASNSMLFSWQDADKGLGESGAMEPQKKTGLTKKGQAKRDAILKAARQCFEQNGYAKTTMDDIAQACRIKKSSLFYYYETKEALFYEGFTRIWEENLAALRDKARKSAPLQSQIQTFIRASALYYGSVARQFGTSPLVLLKTEDEFETIFKPHVEDMILEFYRTVLEEGIAAGVFAPAADAGRVADLIGRVERTFRLDAFKTAVKEERREVDFDRLAGDTVFVVEGLLSIKLD